MDPFDTMSGAERLDDDEEEVLFASKGLINLFTLFWEWVAILNMQIS